MLIIDTINDGAFNQISINVPTHVGWLAMRRKWIDMGYRNWVVDYCVQTPPPGSLLQTVTAMLAFNFDIIPGFQYELLHWSPDDKVDIPNYNVMYDGVSHMAYYTQDVRAETKRISERLDREPIYKFTTLDHSNPYLHGRTRFIESLWDTSDLFGYHMKTVQKIPWDSHESVWS
jgi:hypothetical protein